MGSKRQHRWDLGTAAGTLSDSAYTRAVLVPAPALYYMTLPRQNLRSVLPLSEHSHNHCRQQHLGYFIKILQQPEKLHLQAKVPSLTLSTRSLLV